MNTTKIILLGLSSGVSLISFFFLIKWFRLWQNQIKVEANSLKATQGRTEAQIGNEVLNSQKIPEDQ